MDSDESRPGSSASNSSNSSYTSQPSSPAQIPEEADNEPQDSTQSSVDGRSLSSSSLSTSSSDNENEDKNEEINDENNIRTTSLKRSSSEESTNNQFALEEPYQSSPCEKSRNSSRKSSTSSRESLNKSEDQEDGDINISHEDLSDISDNESEKRAMSKALSRTSIDDGALSVSLPDTKESILEMDNNNQNLNSPNSQEDDDKSTDNTPIESNIDRNLKSPNNKKSTALEDLVKAHDDDPLDFEEEEGECADVCKEDEIAPKENALDQAKKDEKSEGEAEDGEELEEGEVSDEDEKRPEENEPKPVCRFYTRGQCTWGMSCRFLHPGVTDKGNYTMFENMVRSVPVAQSNVGIRGSAYSSHVADFHDYRSERPPMHHRSAMHHSTTPFPSHNESRPLLTEGPVVVENAWERGLRTAKEMMRKANKRKEQDMDFEDKKMNLTVSPDDLEKDSYYIKERERTTPPEFNMYSPPDRFGRSVHVPPIFDDIDPYGRSARYRELPPHRMPQYEDERRVRPTREVIVQRVEPPGRGDEWNDPWMRSKSPGGRGGSRDRGEKRRRDHHSYSSNSSYSSSSSSQSGSSSDSSRSPSPANNRRRYNTSTHLSPSFARKQSNRAEKSPSVPHRRGRHSPGTRFSPGKRRGKISPSPNAKRSAYSPVQKRKKLSPYINKKFYSEKNKTKRRQTTSSSGSGSSSDSSASGSDSDSGSSSTDSSHSRKLSPLKRSRVQDKALHERKHTKKQPNKKRSPITIEIKKPMTVGTSALVSPTNSLSSEKDNKKSRREELLKQLRAVEDAIAKKRSKLS